MGQNSYRGRSSRKGRTFPLLLLAALLLTGFLYWSNRSLQTEHFTFSSPHLPAGFDGCTIVHLTDLHGATFGEDNADLLSVVSDAAPDYIFLTGDLLDQYRETPTDYAYTLCADLAAIAPTFFVTGNHEWALGGVRTLKSEIRAAGVTVLTNEFLFLEREGDSILLAGIDDPNGFADQKTPAELASEIHDARQDGFWILLAHRNNHFVKEYSTLGADLVISGHAHGGIIRLPFTDGLIGTDRDLFPSYTSGFYEMNKSTLFVSRGVGNSGHSFRLFNRPQVAVLTLARSK